VANPLAPLRLLTLDLVAHDRDRVAAKATMDLQVLDDPAELENPQPNFSLLEELARISGGQVLHSGADLRHVLDGHTTGPGEVIVQKAPLWDHAGLWLVLLGLLTTEWVLRRYRGLA
jgi:hypothetical protein